MTASARDGQVTYDCRDCDRYDGYVGDVAWDFDVEEPGDFSDPNRFCPFCDGRVLLAVIKNGTRQDGFYLDLAETAELALISRGLDLFQAYSPR